MISTLPSILDCWLATSYLHGVSLIKLHLWLKAKGDFQALFAADAQALATAGFAEKEIVSIQGVNWGVIARHGAWHQRYAQILTFADAAYPARLKEIADPPLVLYVSGELSLLSQPQLAVVGSRHASANGLESAASFAGTLVKAGLVITSGLAGGIDGACHQGALDAEGATVAVIGTGLDQTYPREHRALSERIKQRGAVISEFPLGSGPIAWHFPLRNRIISGLSLGVLVVEAALRSGSLITARLALEQNREVFAIPGSIHHTLARGCNALIRQGAKLVECAEDILVELNSVLPKAPKRKGAQKPKQNINKEEKAFLSHIDHALTAFELILVRSRLTVGQVSSMLLSLELKGYVAAVPGGYLRVANHNESQICLM